MIILQILTEIASFLAMENYRQSGSDRHCEERSNLCHTLHYSIIFNNLPTF
jgi:hypothetical protein